MESAENSWAAALTTASTRIRRAAKHVLCVFISVLNTHIFDAVCRSDDATSWLAFADRGATSRKSKYNAAMTMAKVIIMALGFFLAGSPFALSQAAPQTATAAPSTVTEISADLGPCKVAFHVTDLAGNPLYNAKIKTTIRYGFLSKRRLELEAATNADGRARFIKLPAQVKQPMQFDVVYQDQTASFSIDPATDCEAERTVPLSIGKAEKAK
jgi:hypothetical protein